MILFFCPAVNFFVHSVEFSKEFFYKSTKTSRHPRPNFLIMTLSQLDFLKKEMDWIEKRLCLLPGKLFCSTFYLSAFTFGGGYVIIPLMRKKFVEQYHWIEEEEMLDLTAIAQSSPGAIAVNASILIGYRLAGLFGALVTVLGTVLPPLIILSVISVAYTALPEQPDCAAGAARHAGRCGGGHRGRGHLDGLGRAQEKALAAHPHHVRLVYRRLLL